MSTLEQQSTGVAGVPDGVAPRVSVVIPCLNEAATIEECVRRARQALDANGIDGEIIVADNGSDDGSGKLAVGAGAQVVLEPERGYGSAYLAGFAAARGRYVVMADADLTYDFDEIPRFVGELEDGADVVIGNRMHHIHPGAMPWHHRYIGNPLLSGFLNLLFRTGVDDAHCGMRALRREVLPRLDLRTTGMEFASEMVIRAAKEKLVIRQFPIEYLPREGESKLSSFSDGWRHLRFLLVHSPNHLFILPGAIMAAVGALVELIVITHSPGVRSQLGHPRADRGSAAGDRRHAGRGARHLRARVRHLLHGRARPLVRSDACPLQARARTPLGARSWSPASFSAG